MTQADPTAEDAAATEVVVSTEAVDAVVFDLDGVITDTAIVHERSWKLMFDGYLAQREGRDTPSQPFTNAEYLALVDGKPRYDGVRSFLAARGIELPEGEDTDPVDRETVRGLGNGKNELFRELLAQGIAPYPSSLTLVRELVEKGIGVAIVSSSRNTAAVLTAAGIAELFPVVVDGNDVGERGLPGKPDPALFLDAARKLGAEPARAVVVEDAVSGVAAGRRGGFAIVVGVDRSGHAADLRAAGASHVVADLRQIRVVGPPRARPHDRSRPPLISELPDATASAQEIAERLRGRPVAVFLDYDGTLSPIVDDPAAAVIDEQTRQVVAGLAEVTTTAVVSGRDTTDVMERVGLPGIVYAGSHGFDIRRGDGTVLDDSRGAPFAAPLDAVEAELAEALADVPGAQLDRKRFSLAVHYRRVPPEHVAAVEPAVDAALARHPELRKGGGKKVFELRPDVDWDKGHAVLQLLEAVGAHALPVYVGDDLTDEDAFRAIRGRGIGVVVRGEDRPTYADYSLEDTEAVVVFLAAIRDLLEGTPR